MQIELNRISQESDLLEVSISYHQEKGWSFKERRDYHKAGTVTYYRTLEELVEAELNLEVEDLL